MYWARVAWEASTGVRRQERRADNQGAAARDEKKAARMCGGSRACARRSLVQVSHSCAAADVRRGGTTDASAAGDGRCDGAQQLRVDVLCALLWVEDEEKMVDEGLREESEKTPAVGGAKVAAAAGLRTL